MLAQKYMLCLGESVSSHLKQESSASESHSISTNVGQAGTWNKTSGSTPLWLGQPAGGFPVGPIPVSSATAAATASASSAIPAGPLPIVPPSGLKLAQDPITGQLFLIPGI